MCITINYIIPMSLLLILQSELNDEMREMLIAQVKT